MPELAADRDYAFAPRNGLGRASRTGRGRLSAGVPRALLAAVAAAAVISGAAAAAASVKVASVSLSGGSSLRVDDLRAWCGLEEGARWLTVDPSALKARLLANPRVASAEVRKSFPGSVSLSIVERAALAVVYARDEGGRIQAHCVDRSGIVFAPASAYAGASSLPVLSGLEIRGLRYGLALDGPFLAALASLASLSESEPALVSAISELRLVSKEGAPAELLIYPSRHHVPVRARPAFSPDLLKSVMLVLDVVEGEGLSQSIGELDVRTDTFVYRTKEAVSG